MFLQRRSITTLVLLVESTNLLLAVGTMPLITSPKEMFHLTYSKCVATLLFVILTEVLKDSIHECDLTHSYEKTTAEWGKSSQFFGL